MENNIKEIKRSIISRYAIALSLIAILSTIAFYALTSVLKESESTAFIVNSSGKQRMLSQRIALDAHRLHIYSSKKEQFSPYAQKQVKNLLKQHIKEMRATNNLLSTGNLPNGDHDILSPTIYNMYFGEMNLVKRVIEYTDLAHKTLGKLSHNEFDAVLTQIDDQSTPLLKDLNSVVLQYQTEGEEKLLRIETMETSI